MPWRGLLLAYGAGQLAANLPITPGGLGVVEGSLVIALVAFGGGQVSTVAAVLLYRIVSFWGYLPVGWLVWAGLTWHNRRADKLAALTAEEPALRQAPVPAPRTSPRSFQNDSRHVPGRVPRETCRSLRRIHRVSRLLGGHLADCWPHWRLCWLSRRLARRLHGLAQRPRHPRQRLFQGLPEAARGRSRPGPFRRRALPAAHERSSSSCTTCVVPDALQDAAKVATCLVAFTGRFTASDVEAGLGAEWRPRPDRHRRRPPTRPSAVATVVLGRIPPRLVFAHVFPRLH